MRAFSGVYIFRWNQLPSKFLSLSIKYLSAAKRDVNNLHFLRRSVDLPAPSEGRAETWIGWRMLGREGKSGKGNQGELKIGSKGSSSEHLSKFLAASKAGLLSGTWFSKEGSC